VGSLAGKAHQTDAPNLAFQRAQSTGNLDVELFQKLIPHFSVIDARWNFHCGDRGQPLGWTFDQKFEAHRFDSSNQRELILQVLTRTRWNRRRAAQELKISYKALLYKLKQIGCEEYGA